MKDIVLSPEQAQWAARYLGMDWAKPGSDRTGVSWRTGGEPTPPSWEKLSPEQIRDDLMAGIAAAFQVPEHMLRGEPHPEPDGVTFDLVKQPDGSWA